MSIIDKYSLAIHDVNVELGWWDDKNRCLETVVQMIITEIAEATEGARKNIKDDHLPDRKMFEVEMADTMIRLLDLGGKFVWSHTYETDSLALDKLRQCTEVGARMFALSAMAVDLGRSLDCGKRASRKYSILVNAILEIASVHKLDLWGAVRDKVAYNKTRADHKRSARKATGGKRF